MILDYAYNKNKRTLSVSYVKETGSKGILNFNVSRFKQYYSTPIGKFTNWDGSRCDVKYVDNPTMFDIKTFFKEMPQQYQDVLKGKTFPKLYTFDIETYIPDDNSFPEPSEAKYPITNISIVSPKCDVVILGTRDISDPELLTTRIHEYLESSTFFMSLKLPMPKVTYIKFNCEEDMLRYFFKNIVAKAPILAGWNSLLFDWQYIQNRVKFYFPNLPLASCSMNWSMTGKKYVDMRNEKVILRIPNHTLILDMMDIIATFDMVVMPIKESMSLDYIASETVGLHKIEYDGSLQDLYNSDYDKYVFYNGIDSILVQLIDKYFKTLQNIYSQALYCNEKIGSCFSKIALSEALVFNYYYDRGIKIVDNGDYSHDRERGQLVGAYVRQPTPGKHNYMCCNDFASLYPSTIITCNLSFENFMGNDFTETQLEEFRKDPNYFVSVNNNVYKNDKVYTFKDIQMGLMADRKVGKYLAKELEANVMVDVTHLLKGMDIEDREYDKRWVDAIKNIGYDVKRSSDLKNIDNLKEFHRKLHDEITYYVSYEQACKLLMNSMYGGSSHQAFFWFNINLANDITGEARNIIHRMEKHIPEYIRDNWMNLKDVHKKLGIKVDEVKSREILSKNDSFVDVVYGDTDSCVAITNIHIKDVSGRCREITIEDFYNENLGKDAGTTLKGHESVHTNSQILNWSDDKKLYYGDIKRIIRHKVTKAKWRLRTKSGKEVIITNDHSLIVFRDGKQVEVKPRDVKKTDKILVVKD